MCLAIPSQIISIDEDRNAIASVGGVRQPVRLDLTPEVEVGDYVLIHAGFAIQKLDAEEAQLRLAIFAEEM